MQWHRFSQFLRYGYFVFFLALVGAFPSIACDVFPTPMGMSWSYLWNTGGSGTFSTDVIGTTWINGYEVFDFLSEYDYDPDGTSHVYYSLNENSDVLLHGGVHDLSSYSEYLYSPPIIILECPLVVGNTWQVSSTYFDNLEGLGEGQPVTYQFEVMSYSLIYTPAGEFFAYLVVMSSAPGEGEVWTWYSPGLGKIKYEFINNGTVWGSYRLLAHEVSVESTAWGRVKALYR